MDNTALRPLDGSVRELGYSGGLQNELLLEAVIIVVVIYIAVRMFRKRG